MYVFSYKLLQVNTGQLVFSEYDVYVTEPLFKTPEEFSRYVVAFFYIPVSLICEILLPDTIQLPRIFTHLQQQLITKMTMRRYDV